MNYKDFIKKYRIPDDNYIKSGLKWANLMAIVEDYDKTFMNLFQAANSIAERLRNIPKAHSVKTRIKESDHLIEKIIRKSLENSEVRIAIDNYRNIVIDLAGVRVMHLFKNDWDDIHEYIINEWETIEKPKAYIREGDEKNRYTDKGCVVENHPYGYRSVHYIIKTQPTKEPVIVEIQVRTIFEEAWSEIDHKMRYPYDKDNPILMPYLKIFNGLAGSADGMGSYIQYLKGKIDETAEVHKMEVNKLSCIIEDLKVKIDKLEIEKKEKEELINKLNAFQIEKINIFDPNMYILDSPNIAGIPNPNEFRIDISKYGLGTFPGLLGFPLTTKNEDNKKDNDKA